MVKSSSSYCSVRCAPGPLRCSAPAARRPRSHTHLPFDGLPLLQFTKTPLPLGIVLGRRLCVAWHHHRDHVALAPAEVVALLYKAWDGVFGRAAVRLVFPSRSVSSFVFRKAGHQRAWR